MRIKNINKCIIRVYINVHVCHSVAVTGFDYWGGGMNFVNGSGVGRKSLKMLTVDVSHILACFAIFLLKLCLQSIASEEKVEKIKCVLGIKYRSAPVRGVHRVRTPPASACVITNILNL